MMAQLGRNASQVCHNLFFKLNVIISVVNLKEQNYQD